MDFTEKVTIFEKCSCQNLNSPAIYKVNCVQCRQFCLQIQPRSFLKSTRNTYLDTTLPLIALGVNSNLSNLKKVVQKCRKLPNGSKQIDGVSKKWLLVIKASSDNRWQHTHYCLRRCCHSHCRCLWAELLIYFTGCKRNCGKVTFSQASVTLHIPPHPLYTPSTPLRAPPFHPVPLCAPSAKSKKFLQIIGGKRTPIVAKSAVSPAYKITFSQFLISVADLRGLPCRHPLIPKIFSISCCILQNLAKPYVGAPLEGWRPPPVGNPGSAPGFY